MQEEQGQAGTGEGGGRRRIGRNRRGSYEGEVGHIAIACLKEKLDDGGERKGSVIKEYDTDTFQKR